MKNVKELSLLFVIFILFLSFSKLTLSLNILQIVPGFTNSHVLFNYRLAEALTSLGHNVTLLTQMELAMVFIGDLKRPKNVAEIQIPIQFRNKFKAEGLKVFQNMIFTSKNDLKGAYDLWWTGQEFKDIRLEACMQMLELEKETLEHLTNTNFDIGIGHFHDFCPVAIAKRLNLNKMIWITHGPSTYNFVLETLGLPTLASYVPHPLSAGSDRMGFYGRLLNFLWNYFVGIEFVNLPRNLLNDQNEMFQNVCLQLRTNNTSHSGQTTPSWCDQIAPDEDLWTLGKDLVGVLMLNGEMLLDFPRPFHAGVIHLEELTSSNSKKRELLFQQNEISLPEPFDSVYENSKSVALFSLGTVSNQTNMPTAMIEAFAEGFSRFPETRFLWKTEQPERVQELLDTKIHARNILPIRWIPQKLLLGSPKTKLLVTHGGYNSLLEVSKAGIPAVIVPLFADQHINGWRARRFGIAEVLDKSELSADGISGAIKKIFDSDNYAKNAEKLQAMLREKPYEGLYKHFGALKYALKLATMEPRRRKSYFALRTSQQLSSLTLYSMDLFATMILFAFILTF